MGSSKMMTAILYHDILLLPPLTFYYGRVDITMAARLNADNSYWPLLTFLLRKTTRSQISVRSEIGDDDDALLGETTPACQQAAPKPVNLVVLVAQEVCSSPTKTLKKGESRPTSESFLSR
jgi:hypothetical protein